MKSPIINITAAINIRCQRRIPISTRIMNLYDTGKCITYSKFNTYLEITAMENFYSKWHMDRTNKWWSNKAPNFFFFQKQLKHFANFLFWLIVEKSGLSCYTFTYSSKFLTLRILIRIRIRGYLSTLSTR